MRIRVLFVAAALCWALPAAAADSLSVDARFDKSGDGLVDAADWAQMSEEERIAYARASLEALGEDPDVRLPEGVTRAERYLQGLKSVYE